jgi:hypothetical protein
MNELLEALIEEMREKGRDDDAAELETLRGSYLRGRLSRLPALEAEFEELKAERARLERAPRVQEAFRAAGVDFGRLSKVERKAIGAYEGKFDEESIDAFIEENELPTT